MTPGLYISVSKTRVKQRSHSRYNGMDKSKTIIAGVHVFTDLSTGARHKNPIRQ